MLKNILLEEWNKISSSYTEKLVSLVNRRLKSCVNAQQNTKDVLSFHILVFL